MDPWWVFKKQHPIQVEAKRLASDANPKRVELAFLNGWMSVPTSQDAMLGSSPSSQGSLEIRWWLVEPTHLKHMFVKMDSFSP